MIAVSKNQKGIIKIEKEAWNSFVENKILVNKINARVETEKQLAEKRFNDNSDKLQEAKCKIQNFNLIERGNAYSGDIKEENEFLIQAFNDNFG